MVLELCIRSLSKEGHGCSFEFSQILHRIYLRNKALEIWINLQAGTYAGLHMSASIHMYMCTHAHPSVYLSAPRSIILFVCKLNVCCLSIHQFNS